MTEDGYDVLLLREPGSTALGTYLRDWLKSQRSEVNSLDPLAELLLFAAARTQLVSESIRPALQTPGQVVICDRYVDSTVAYQGYGRRIELATVHAVNAIAVAGVVPDLTFLLDCPPGDALRRVDPQTGLDGDADGMPAPPRPEPEGMRRFEEEGAAFHERVYRGYLAMAAEAPDRWRVVDGTMPEAQVAEEVRRLTAEALVSIAPKRADSPTTAGDPTASDGGDDQQASLF